MVSEMMLEDVADLAKRGVQLSPREVVRLNAFGLRAERGTVSTALFSIRRACICHDMVFYEPTIGHHVWLAEAERVLDLEDNEMWCYVRAFWLATARAENLPAVGLPHVCALTIRAWADAHLRDVTLRELSAAMDYAEKGADAESGEAGPTSALRGEDEIMPADDWCSEVGVVRESQSLGLGIPLEDALGMTHAQLRAVVDRALVARGGVDGKTARLDAVGDYQRVLEEIANAHGVKG